MKSRKNAGGEKSNEIHTRIGAVVFRAKASILTLRRAATDLFAGSVTRHKRSQDLADAAELAESKTPLWTESAPEEQFLLAGKVENLRRAVAAIDGVEVPAGSVFSFWKHVGRATKRKGYVVGRELREGCIIPSVGGGLCQLSNALYDVALKAGFEIVERHAHTAVVPGSLAESGRDATVFWNYVDLRFFSETAFRIEARLGRDHLRVVFRGRHKPATQFFQISPRSERRVGFEPNSCAMCGVESCFRSLKPDANLEFSRTAFVLDEFTPEFDKFVASARTAKDLLFIPLDGRKFGKPNYAWTTNGFHDLNHSVFQTIRRAFESRRLAAQGAARQRALMENASRLAESYVRRLPFDATHICVSQNLLPFLWKSGALGGRTFDVLMSALPIAEIQRRLDAAAELHPESPTLGDFRADSELVAAEMEALAEARRIVTPHRAIGSLFGDRTQLLDWEITHSSGREEKPDTGFTIAFPASTVGRKGCYELREALRGTETRIILFGPILEGESFWEDFDIVRGGNDLISAADVVVLPAHVEHRPRRLLSAIGRGIPVIATAACGVDGLPGVTTIREGDADALRDAIFAVRKETKF